MFILSLANDLFLKVTFGSAIYCIMKGQRCLSTVTADQLHLLPSLFIINYLSKRRKNNTQRYRWS